MKTTISERDRLLEQAEELIQRPNFSKEDSARASALIALADSLDDRRDPIRRARLDRATEQQNEIQESEFRAYLIQGGTPSLSQYRALSATVDASGGFIVPKSFTDRFELTLKAYDGLFDAATVFTTTTGSPCTYPIVDDVGTDAVVVAQNTISAEADVLFSQLAFESCPCWRTGLVRVPSELIKDSNFDMARLLGDAFAKRFARGIGAAFVTTILAGAALGVTAASASAVTTDEVLDLMGSVDSGYGTSGSFLMSWETYIKILKLKAGGATGEYVAKPELDANGRPLLFGRPVYLCPSMPSMAAAAKCIVYGDLTRFVRREVKGSLAVKTEVERFAEYDQVAFEGFWRVDGGLLITSNAAPVKYLRNA